MKLEEVERLGTDLAGVTEYTARQVMFYSGKGDKHRADQAAVESMRDALNRLDLKFHVVLGEGGKDEAPMLYSGEVLGRKAGDAASEAVDLIVDPLECTTNFARGLPDSMVVLLAAPAGTVRAVPGTYMEQMLLPPGAAHLIHNSEINLDTPVPEVLEKVAAAMDHDIDELCVVVQDRPRHEELIAKIREAGAGISLIDSGSISSAFRVILGRSRRTHMLWGTFGAPEGVVIAFMAREARGGFLGRIQPHNDESRAETAALGLEGRTLNEKDFVQAGGVIVLSGIHSSSLLRGVELIREAGERRHRVYTIVWTKSGQQLLVHEGGVLKRTEPFV